MLERPAEIAKAVFAAKRRRREQVRCLSIEEKLQILVRLQRMASEIVASCGRESRRPWELRTGRERRSS
ncbi:MAG: hypothetical protein LAO51_02195 [Acidobacteriia bacterium]|nr:hypothetical protein [Terriglobia bacterium]